MEGQSTVTRECTLYTKRIWECDSRRLVFNKSVTMRAAFGSLFHLDLLVGRIGSTGPILMSAHQNKTILPCASAHPQRGHRQSTAPKGAAAKAVFVHHY